MGFVTRRDASIVRALAQWTPSLPPLRLSLVMPAFQTPLASGSNKRKNDQHDPNFANRKRPAVDDNSSAMEGDYYWMVQWCVSTVGFQHLILHLTRLV